MNKKAQTLSDELLPWIPRIVFLIIVYATTTGVISAYVLTNVNIGGIESHILMHRLQFSPDGITEYDTDTKRVYPGIIDTGKLNNLEAALTANDGVLAAKLKVISLPEDSEQIYYLHKETYEDWQPIAIVVGTNDEISGTGRKFPYEEIRYVYLDGPAKLETVVILPDDQ